MSLWPIRVRPMRLRPAAARAISLLLLAGLPAFLLWPVFSASPASVGARYMVAAIYRYPSGQLPHCGQFAQRAGVTAQAIIRHRPVACRSDARQRMI